MGTRNSSGFTIIETMLFLAVTGLLVLGVLIGTGTSINRQRYRDAVESFKGLVQSQYADLGSVRNDRSNTWNCDASALPTEGGTEIRGQSDCFLVGKFMTIKGGAVKTYTVLAREKTGATTKANDIATLDANYTYNVSDTDIKDDTLSWGTQLAWPQTGSGAQTPTTPRSISLLFIRSPKTGNVYTFTNDAAPDRSSISQATFTNIIAAGATIPGQGERTLCLQSNGLFTTGDSSIYIAPYASSASAVEVRTNEFIKSLGQTTQC